MKDFHPIRSRAYYVLNSSQGFVQAFGGIAEMVLLHQIAFVGGRQILEATLVANEVVKDVPKWVVKEIFGMLDLV